MGMTMLPAGTYDELLASASTGRYHAGPSWLSFIADPSLVGVMMWGHPTGEQTLELLQAHERMRPVLASRVGAIVDVRHLEWPSSDAYDTVVGFLATRRDWLAEYIAQLALVRSTEGPVGAAAAGFFDVSAKPFSAATFTDLAEALAWIGRKDAEPLAAELDALFAEATGTPAPLRRLRQQLASRPGTLSLEDAARALGVTARTLQRQLQTWQTSFRAEQNRAQVRAAKELLEKGDAPLAAIAADVGCASLSHFSAMFRRVTGETPRDWRRRHGRGE
jgi:AraC-like DNA-binding protein